MKALFIAWSYIDFAFKRITVIPKNKKPINVPIAASKASPFIAENADIPKARDPKNKNINKMITFIN